MSDTVSERDREIVRELVAAASADGDFDLGYLVYRFEGALAAARAEEREANCKAVCPACRGAVSWQRQEPVPTKAPGRYGHQFGDGSSTEWCHASAIRARQETTR